MAKLFLLALIAFHLNAFAGAKKAPVKTRKPAADDQETLLQQHPELKGDCDKSKFVVKAIHLRVSAEEPDELTTVCQSNCGANGGCSYQIFTYRNGGYQKIADFFGVFEALPDVSHGYHDIRVRSRLGGDQQEFTLQFDGQTYP